MIAMFKLSQKYIDFCRDMNSNAVMKGVGGFNYGKLESYKRIS